MRRLNPKKQFLATASDAYGIIAIDRNEQEHLGYGVNVDES
jgi:hypothetical protein